MKSELTNSSKSFKPMSVLLHSLCGDLNSCKQHFNISNRYTDPCCFYWKEGRQVYICVRDAFLLLQRQFHLCARHDRWSDKYHSLKC
jgi:hypothetical protein